MRYDAEHKMRTRTKVLSEAIAVIRAEGPARLGVADVMKRAGLTHGGFYAHFQSREDLMMEALAQMFASAKAPFDKRASDLPARQALRAYVSWYLSEEHSQATSWGCPMPLLSGDIPRLPDEARRRYAEGFDRLSEALADRLRNLGREDAAEAASSALAEMIGALNLARATPDPVRAHNILQRSRDAVLGRLGVAAA